MNKYYRIRMITNLWFVNYYTSFALADYNGSTGSYDTLEEAQEAAKTSGCRDADKGEVT